MVELSSKPGNVAPEHFSILTPNYTKWLVLDSPNLFSEDL